MSLTLTETLWFLPFLLPLCLHVAWTDVTEMKIRNRTVLLMVGVFAVTGLFALPAEEYLWRYSHLFVLLLVGMLANAAGGIGAGDVKFISAASLFVPKADWMQILAVFTVVLVIVFLAHRAARASALARRTAHWESWSREGDFPLGLALGPSLLVYLALPLFG